MQTNNKEKLMQLMYDEAKNYLQELCPENINLNKYFNIEKTYKSKNDNSLIIKKLN